MIKFNLKDAKEIGDGLGINWNEVNVDEFTKGLNVELEHSEISPKTNVSDNDWEITGKIAWAHLNEFTDYNTRLEKLEIEAKEY